MTIYNSQYQHPDEGVVVLGNQSRRQLEKGDGAYYRYVKSGKKGVWQMQAMGRGQKLVWRNAPSPGFWKYLSPGD